MCNAKRTRLTHAQTGKFVLSNNEKIGKSNNDNGNNNKNNGDGMIKKKPPRKLKKRNRRDVYEQNDRGGNWV